MTPSRGDLFDPACPTRHLLDRLGGKWTVMIVLRLAEHGELRFTAVRDGMPGVSQKMLSTTLQSLCRDGLVVRRVEATVPVRVHYALTGLGQSLVPLLSGLRDWAEEHMAEMDEAGRDRSARSGA